MACRKVLVLCGDTYPDRLWCAWELYTLFSFVLETEAVDRLVFLPFGEEFGANVLDRLRKFDVCDAHCYDPNEEGKLLRVIRAGGVDHFNAKIRRLADGITPQDLVMQPVQP